MMLLDFNDYQILAARTEKPLQNPARTYHHYMGLIGETGELCDAIKKHLIYRKPLDVDNVWEEFGDIFWYFAGLCNVKEWSMQTFMEEGAKSFLPTLSLERGIFSLNYAVANLTSQGYSANYIFDIQKVATSLVSMHNRVALYSNNRVALYSKLEMSLIDIARDNILKLKRRYPEAYTDTDALERKDKA